MVRWRARLFKPLCDRKIIGVKDKMATLLRYFLLWVTLAPRASTSAWAWRTSCFRRLLSLSPSLIGRLVD